MHNIFICVNTCMHVLTTSMSMNYQNKYLRPQWTIPKNQQCKFNCMTAFNPLYLLLELARICILSFVIESTLSGGKINSLFLSPPSLLRSNVSSMLRGLKVRGNLHGLSYWRESLLPYKWTGGIFPRLHNLPGGNISWGKTEIFPPGNIPYRQNM